MATPDERWQRLEPASDQEVFQLVDPAHPLAFYLGRGPLGQRLLLLVTSDDVPAPREFRGFRLRTWRRRDGQASLVLESASGVLDDVFGRLCEDLIGLGRSVADPRYPVQPLMRRLGHWAELLARSPTGLLDPAGIRGLIGELVAMRDVVAPACGMAAAIRGWLGPDAADQDFRAEGRAWEVKAVSPAASTVRIASERQLCSALPLELVVVRLDDQGTGAPAAASLNSLVQELRELVSGDPELVQVLDDRLARAGYLPRSEYDQPVLRVLDITRHEVRDGFPRLCPGDLPHGVEKVGYEVRLADCAAFRVGAPGVGEGNR